MKSLLVWPISTAIRHRVSMLDAHIAGQAWQTIEEEPIEELGCSSEAKPIRQDCPPPGAIAPGMPSGLLTVSTLTSAEVLVKLFLRCRIAADNERHSYCQHMHQQALLRPMLDAPVQPQSWLWSAVICPAVCVCTSSGTYCLCITMQHCLTGPARLTITSVGQWQVPWSVSLIAELALIPTLSQRDCCICIATNSMSARSAGPCGQRQGQG